MGVAGLLPALRSAMDQVHVSKYAGKTAGVDACGWLYKGAYSCAADVALGRDTDVYLNYCVQLIRLLQDNGVTPVLVFDGAPLPAKARLNDARNRSRAIWRDKARRLLEEGDARRQEAASAASRALSVSNDMVLRLIGVLRRMGVAFYVAPYEADAQLAFLSKAKLVDVVISEDSDCVPYGCKTTLFKLRPDGWGCELKRRSLGANEELSFLGWSDEMLVVLCVLSGCDYCPSVPGVGLVTAYRLVLEALESGKAGAAPDDYRARFLSAVLTFRHHLVFDPRDAASASVPCVLAAAWGRAPRLTNCRSLPPARTPQKLKMLNPIAQSAALAPLVDARMAFLGDVTLSSAAAAAIARGDVHPATLESYAWAEAARASSAATSAACAPPTRGRDEEPRGAADADRTLLDGLLGPSAHILRFRSPKVSDNFRPLSAREPSAPGTGTGTGRIRGSMPMAARRPMVPTRYRGVRESASGFAGEVRCRVDAPRPGAKRPRVVRSEEAEQEEAPPSASARAEAKWDAILARDAARAARDA